MYLLSVIDHRYNKYLYFKAQCYTIHVYITMHFEICKKQNNYLNLYTVDFRHFQTTL